MPAINWEFVLIYKKIKFEVWIYLNGTKGYVIHRDCESMPTKCMLSLGICGFGATLAKYARHYPAFDKYPSGCENFQSS